MFYFAPELILPREIQIAKMGGRFVSGHHKDSNILSNRSDNRPKAIISLGKVGSTVFSFFNHFLSDQMPREVKNATGAKHSTPASRATYESGKYSIPDSRDIYNRANGVKSAPALSDNTVSDTSPLLSLTKKQLVSVIERRGTEAQAKTNYFDLAMQHFLFWMNCERTGAYGYDTRDQRLLDGLQALRTSFGVGKTYKF